MKESHLTQPAPLTYWQTLKVIAIGVLQWPLNGYEVGEFLKAAWEMLWILFIVVMRIVIVLTYPVSIFIVAAFIQLARIRVTKKRASVANETKTTKAVQ